MPRVSALGVLCAALGVSTTSAGVPPPGFAETILVDHIYQLTGFDWAPNGDLWIITKVGQVRLLRAGGSVPIIVRRLTVDDQAERGLVGIAVDPDFSTNSFVYLFYTTPAPTIRSRVSRFTSAGDQLLEETIIWQGPPHTTYFHVSGHLLFGPDGMLYISTGDNGVPDFAQDLSVPYGKILRVARDGSIPPDNPFIGTPGAAPEVWAYGFRNPWRFSFQPGTGNMFIGDVGYQTWEELDLGLKGGNFGWPLVEGPHPPGVPGVIYPIYWYNHNGSGAALIGGEHMVAGNFPAQYEGDYFFCDYVLDKVYRMKLDDANQPLFTEVFVSQTAPPIMVRVGPDGALYYGSINFQTIYRVAWVGGSGSQPVAVATATPPSGVAPLASQLDATASWDPDGDPLTFSWSLGDGTTSTLAAPLHSYAPGAWSPRVTVSDGSLSSSATLRVVSGNRAPAAAIVSPVDGATFNAGDTIHLHGDAFDPDEGALGAASLAWTVIFHHNTHTHPFLGPISGIATGSFMTDELGEPAHDIWYEIRLTATDSGAPVGGTAWLADTRSVNIYPNLGTFSMATAPRPDLTLKLDGAPFTAPRTQVGVVGHLWTLEAPSPQNPGDGHAYTFLGWSDGGGRQHAIRTPETDTAWTATFGCDVRQTVSGLQLANAPGGQITLAWDPVTDICLTAQPARYRIYEASTARPVSPPGSFPLDPAFSVTATATGNAATLTPGPGLRYYLVTAVGSDGQAGPIGRYGN